MPQSAAHEAHQIAALALEQVQHAYSLLDHEFRYVFINREAERLALFNRAELIGKCMWEEFPDVLSTKFEHEVRRVASERVSSSFENYYATLDRWFHAQVDPMDGGIIIGFRDITQEKALQDELSKSKDIIALVSESDLIGSFRWSIPDDQVIVSPEIYELCGLKPGQSAQDSSFWNDCVHSDDREMMAQPLRCLKQTGT